MLTEAGPENLYAWIARSLAARLSLDPATLPARPTLDDVVTRHLANHGRREDLCTRIRSIMPPASATVSWAELFGPSPFS